MCTGWLMKERIQMHGTHNFKIIDAQHASNIDTYRNVTLKLLKTNAAFWCKELCRMKQLTPKYIHIKVHGNDAHIRNILYVQ